MRREHKEEEQPMTHDSEGGEGAKWQRQSDEMQETSGEVVDETIRGAEEEVSKGRGGEGTRGEHKVSGK